MQKSKSTDKYLAALGLQGHPLDFPFLGELVRRHVATFAFSSVSCRLGDELPLDFESLLERIVVRRRGGYCFEQNGLLFEMLTELGFDPELYLARVIYDQDTHPGLTHRISVIRHDGQPYILDVGFGSDGPRVPVHLSDRQTEDGDRIFRVKERSPGEYHLQVIKDGRYFSLYRFELARYGQADCEVGHFYSHRHPKASFVNHLVVSLLLEQETRSLRDKDYWVIKGGETVKQPINDAQHLEQILVRELGIQISSDEAHRLFEGMAE